jgi:hypothetical protein
MEERIENTSEGTTGVLDAAGGAVEYPKSLEAAGLSGVPEAVG